MNRLIKKTQLNSVSRLHAVTKNLFGLLVAGALACIVSCSDTEQASGELTIEPVLGQAVFAVPEDAANAFVEALKNNDADMFKKLLGADFREVLPTNSVDDEDVTNFMNAWEKSNSLLPQGEKKVLLAVGEGDWTLPIPISEGESGWYFDVDEGIERLRIRRIGRNELSTMQAVLAFYDAQMEYAQLDRNDNGMLEYAQRFISTQGTQDGLFWGNEDGETTSPLGPLMADHEPGGGYHGYYYRILNSQGEAARGGSYNYLIGEKMRAGFALIVWPEKYGESGVMSFMVSHAGIVYEQNLGPDGTDIAEAMSSFNPDEGWQPVKEVSGP